MQTRRRVLKSLAVAVAASGLPARSAASYPERTLRMLVGFPAGQSTDLIARVMADELHKSLGQAFVVENRPGVAATMAADAAAKAVPDGYTLLMSSSGPLCVAPSLYPKLGYDPLKDLTPIALITKVPLVLVVNPAFPARTFAEFIALAQAQGDGLNYGSSGTGITNHLVMEMLKGSQRLNIRHIPYKGSTPALTDLIGGMIPVMFDTAPVTLPHIKSGRLRALAVTSLTRVPDLPDVPTIAESGIPGFEGLTWAALMAPASTPMPIIERLNADTLKALLVPEVRDKLLALGTMPSPLSLADTRAYIRAETTKWSELVKRAGITLE